MPFKTILFTFLISIYSYSQIGGRYTYQFLNLVNNPRQAAFGGTDITSFQSNPSQALENPAALNKSMSGQLAVNYVNYISDISYGSVAYAHTIGDKQRIIYTGITYIDYGSFDGYDEFGNSTGDFGANEVAITIGHARPIPNSDFHLGINMKFISSRLEQYSSLGGAIDMGIIYRKASTKFDAAFMIRNLGTQFTTYDAISEKLPFSMSFGMAKRLSGVPLRWSFTLENLQTWNLTFRNTARDISDLNGDIIPDDPSFLNNILRHMVWAIEFFPEGNFKLRLGYNFRRSEELRIIDQRSFAGLSGGFSLKMGVFNFAYSYARYHAAAASGTFGVNINIKPWIKKI